MVVAKDKTRIVITLPKILVERLDNTVEKLKTPIAEANRSSVVKHAIERYLDELEKEQNSREKK